MTTAMVLPTAAASAAAAYNPPPSRAAGSPAKEPPQPANSPPLPNPQLRIDPALSLVVIEFRDKGGEVALSIPTPKELEAYRDKPRAEPSAGVDVSS